MYYKYINIINKISRIYNFIKPPFVVEFTFDDTVIVKKISIKKPSLKIKAL